MKQFIALFAFALVVNAYDNIEARTQWLQFKAQHGKSYKNLVEETTRFQVFQENLKQIEQHNAKYEAGLSTWKMGVTQFADQTPEEFVESLKTNRPTTGEIKIKKSVPHKDFIVIDDEIDWRKQGAVSPVKNTGVCGCTNSVAAAGGLETQWYLKYEGMELFSDQALTDCSPVPPDYPGCFYKTIYIYMELAGIPLERKYHSTCGTCNYTGDGLRIINVATVVDDGDENKLATGLRNGTIAISYQATSNMMLYVSGVFDDDTCEQTQPNLGLLVVGYGSENGTDYWIIRNSWGESWGEEGYFRTVRNKENRCGVANEGYLPII